MTAVAIAGFAVAIYAAWLFHDMPDGSELADFHPVTSARVFAWDGTLIGEYGQERRIYVPYSRIPDRVAKAFLAAEDRNFFSHNGVDVSGVSRAMAKNVFNLLRGKRFEGGSTITQQVAKNLLLNNERTVGRKLKEVIMARRLESSLPKEQILELYLNDIYLGYRSYGVGAAAFNYFGKSLDELTLSETAFLAALPKGPENYRPSTHKAEAIGRRNWVIGEMVKAGWVTREEGLAAMKDDLVIQDKPRRAKYQDADYFVSEVELRARKLFPNDAIYTEGYYVKTTLDPRLQTMAREALMDGLETYDRRHGWRGAWGHVNSNDPNWQDQALQHDGPAERPDWKPAMVTSASSGGVKFELAEGGDGSLIGADVSWAFATRGIKTGDLVFVEKRDNGWHLRQVPKVNGALVAIDPFSGRIIALVGGYSYSLSKFNRATQALRQPGSSIKPFVYAVALSKDFTPASIIDDGPITMMGGDGKAWSPENYEHDYLGMQPIRRGLELSRNLMTVRLAQKAGIKNITQGIVNYGVLDKMPSEMSMVLGAGEVNPYRLTNAYSIFVNGGRKVKPHLIDEVQDRNGKVIYKADERVCPAACTADFDGLESPRLPLQGDQVLDPITAYEVNSMLQGVVQRGTGAAARSLGIPMGGKTGTTNDYRSAWFVGFTADLVVGVFVGFDDNSSLGNHETGAVAALPIWMDFMKSANAGKPNREFQKPRDAVYMSVRGIEEAFKPGTEPKYEAAPASEDGPKPYLDTWTDEGAPGEPVKVVPAEEPPPPPKKRPADEAGTLY
ncbi:penicillin-binding protein 1A [Asticcacaulis sp. 201]|uniref:penicillin-binding protein 1A n=1 Tax=Asticcacaulis sp. 201 TaxID=3028787 RepID=UPI002916C01B|nr:penicillin-binding protein 1A [Asticcacaulis sp. 201]MDV6329462.1 penicillin-binding protein 1A [Asticcacaulis sp. 201]